jgi:hypothetical protein
LTLLTSLLLCSSLIAAPKPAITPIVLTVRQLIMMGDSGALAKLAAQDFPAVTAYRISRIISMVQPEIARAMKSRQSLFTDDNSTSMPSLGSGGRQVKPEKMEAFMAALNPLLDEKVEVSVTPLSFDDDLAGAKFSARDIEALGPLLRKPVEAVPAVK